MYPLRFEPIFRRYLWGGRRLFEALGKQIGDQDCAESWEIVDHNEDQSIVSAGALAGKSLNELVRTRGEELLGPEVAARVRSTEIPIHLRYRFPLLLKFLDANRDLSVQVHPDDQMGRTLSPPDLGKTEAWYVIEADKGSRIYAGLKQGVGKREFRQAVENGNAETLLHGFQPSPGDCVFIKAGTVHAIGAGLLIAEIQQASDTTFRIFDWNRVDQSGTPRALHIEQGIAATDFALGPVMPGNPVRLADDSGDLLVENEKFVLQRRQFSQPISVGGDGRFRIIAVTKGAVGVQNDPSGSPLETGGSILIPACCAELELVPQADVELLEVFVR